MVGDYISERKRSKRREEGKNTYLLFRYVPAIDRQTGRTLIMETSRRFKVRRAYTLLRY